ncbi:mitochondrial 54S ribosomal protein YmL19 [Saitoella coloradoensis]
MSKAVQKTNVLLKLLVPAGGATPQPPIGPALGARGVKSIDFCKEFNARTAKLVKGTPVPCIITVRPDRTFSFDTTSPPTSYLLLKAAGLEKGSSTPGQKNPKVGTISVKHVYEIAKIKHKDTRLQELSLEAIAKSIVGSAKSMGIAVVP